MKSGINLGKLTDSQIVFIETVPFHLEERPGDPDMLRAVWPSLKQTGRWFSRRLVTVQWEFFKPSVEIK